MKRLDDMESAQAGKEPTTSLNEPASIILLHDGGGDRSETVRAIPMLAKALRARGYEIVPVYELLGKTREQVMPPISSDERLTARIDNVAFSLFFVILNFIAAVFFFGDVLMTARLTLIGFAAIFDRLHDHADDAKLDRNYKPRIAVLVPAFNEELVIERTVRSVLASDYTDIHVIVIDDGSSDKTLEVARAAFAKEIADGKVTVITQANGGKAMALNHGLKYVKEEVFVAIDADTNIDRKAISYLVPHFSNPKIGALAGNAKVGNRVNLWTRWQALEYITSQNFERRALNTLGAVSVVPGAIGAWRTAAVRELGGYSTITVAEDADLTMSLLRAGYRVEYEDRALAFTEAPMDANGLMRQRFRWSFGILQSVFKHRAAIWRGGKLGWIAIPNIIVFQIMLPLVSPFIDIMFAFGFISYFFERHYHPDTSSVNGLLKLSLYFVIFLLVDFLASLLAFLLERKEARQVHDKWLLTQVWLQRFAYRQLFSIVLFRTLKRAVDGRPFAWDKQIGRAHV
jgi:cellulose synthase/poly-beta-1,6-N-acetylglucosamine synthase-like glycosyltransferase